MVGNGPVGAWDYLGLIVKIQPDAEADWYHQTPDITAKKDKTGKYPKPYKGGTADWRMEVVIDKKMTQMAGTMCCCQGTNIDVDVIYVYTPIKRAKNNFNRVSPYKNAYYITDKNYKKIEEHEVGHKKDTQTIYDNIIKPRKKTWNHRPWNESASNDPDCKKCFQKLQDYAEFITKRGRGTFRLFMENIVTRGGARDKAQNVTHRTVGPPTRRKTYVETKKGWDDKYEYKYNYEHEKKFRNK